MKSWNAVANVTDRMLSRLGRLSFLSIMVLSLAMGQPALVADEFQLWQRDSVGAEYEPLEHLDEEGTKKAVKWTVTEPSSENFKKFVTTWQKQPFKLVQGFKAGMLKAIEDKKLDSFLKTAKEEIGKLDAKDFGGFVRQNAIKDLLAAMAEMDKEDLENEDFLKELFSDPAVLLALGLVEEDPNAEEEEKPGDEKPGDEKPGDEKPTPPLEEEKPGDDTPEEKPVDEPAETTVTEPPPERDGEVDLLRDQLAQMQQALQNLSLQRVNNPANTGEVNDAALQAQAQIICDKFNALDEDLEDKFAQQLEDALNPFEDALNDTFNRLAQVSAVPQVAQNQNRNQLEDILPGLLQNALGEEEEQPLQPPTPPTASAPIAPPQDDRNESSPFDQLPPPPQEQLPPEEPQQPLFFPSAAPRAITPQVGLDLPTSSGRAELREAEEALAQIKSRVPVTATLGPAPQLPELVMAKARVQGEAKRAQAALDNARYKADQLDEQLEQLKGGGRDALSPSVKRQEAQLQQQLKDAQRKLEQFQQQAQAMAQGGANPQALQQQMQQMQQAVSVAEDNIARFEAEKEIKIQEGNKAVKSLAKQRDRLRSTVSKLEGEVGQLKEEETALQQMINQNMQLQMQAIQGPPPTTATPNVNRIQQFGTSGGAPRTQAPSNLGGLGLRSTGSTATQSPGRVQRGSLGAQ